MRKYVFGLITGLIIAGTIGVYAAIKIQANEIGYKNDTVESALNYLYQKVGGEIGQVYSSVNFGHQRLESMSTTIENLPSGKYLCSATYSAASAGEQNAEGNWNSSISFTGCDNSNTLNQRSVISGSANLHGNSYGLAQYDVKLFECNISNTSDVTVTAANTAANWIPWVLNLNCVDID